MMKKEEWEEDYYARSQLRIYVYRDNYERPFGIDKAIVDIRI